MESDRSDTIEMVAGSGNVFADLGLDNSEELLEKARLAQVIRERIATLGMTQNEASKRMGTDQRTISQIKNGKIASFTYDRLLRFLRALDYDVEITVTLLALK